MHREPDLSERNSNFGLFLVIKQKPLEKKKKKRKEKHTETKMSKKSQKK